MEVAIQVLGLSDPLVWLEAEFVRQVRFHRRSIDLVSYIPCRPIFQIVNGKTDANDSYLLLNQQINFFHDNYLTESENSSSSSHLTSIVDI